MATTDKIKGYFVYTSINSPKLKYGSVTEKEYTVGIIVSEEDAEAFEDKKYNKKVKEIRTSEFKEKYKFEPPFPDQKKQYLIVATQNVLNSRGEALSPDLRPRAYHKKEDGKLYDITDKNIGNGSYGTLRINVLPIMKNQTSDKPSIKLSAILVEDLIEYEGNKDEWASESVNRVEIAEPTVTTSAARASSPSVSALPEDDEDDSDLPF